MKKGLRRFPELDGLRGIAALYIFLHHFWQAVRLPAHASVFERSLNQIAAHGYLAVDLFFVLSGFLITSLLLLDKSNEHFFNNFYWKRVLRIQPAFLTFLCMFWLLVPGSHRYVLLCLLFVANFASRFYVSMISPAWTLCIEEQFYLLWPQVVRRCKTATVARLAVMLFVFSTLLRPLVLLFHHEAANLQYTFYRLDGLSLGALAACTYIASEEIGGGRGDGFVSFRAGRC